MPDGEPAVHSCSEVACSERRTISHYSLGVIAKKP